MAPRPLAGARRAFDRFTRDRVSRFVWGGLTIALIALLVVALVVNSQAKTDARSQAESRAETWVKTTLFSNLSGSLVSEPILGANYRDLVTAVQSQIMVDERVVAIRIWKPDGTLIFSTDGRDKEGQKTTAPQVTAVGSPSGKTVSISPSPALFDTFVPLHVPDLISVVGSAEIDQSLPLIDAGAHSGWSPLEPWLLVAALVCAAMTLFSLRAPVSTFGAGVFGFEPGPQRATPKPSTEAPEPSAMIVRRAQLAEEIASKAQADLDEAMERLRVAEEWNSWLDSQLKRAQSTAGRDGADRQVEPYQPAEHSASDPIDGAISSGLEMRVRQLEEELHNAVARAHEADARAEEAERAAIGASGEVANQRMAANAAEAQAEAYRRAVDEAKMQVELANARADDAERHPAELGEVEQEMLRSLEARIVAAESRASLAERRLEEMRKAKGDGAGLADHLDEAGIDLRARLARTAARKKLPAEQVEQVAASRDESGSFDGER